MERSKLKLTVILLLAILNVVLLGKIGLAMGLQLFLSSSQKPQEF